MLPTIEEYNQSTASNYEKHFYRLCIERKIPDWTKRINLGGFNSSGTITRRGGVIPPDFKIDIIYEDKENEDE